MSRYLAFPYALDTNGRTRMVDYDAYLVQMMEQIVFVEQGERVNRPGFGCYVLGLPFSANADEMASALGAFLQSALHQWVGDVVAITGVDIANRDAVYTVTIDYQDNRSKALRRVALSNRGSVA